MEIDQFGVLLKQLREEKNLTKAELAKQTGLTVRAIYYWEQGKRTISFENAQKLLNALDKELIIQNKPA